MRHQETFSITQFEQLSGIKSHTIRIWESRYGLFNPGRSQTHLRRYTLEDLDRLLDIALLNQKGHKISRLAFLGPQKIKWMIEATSDVTFNYKRIINQLILCMYASDFEKFEAILHEATLILNLDYTIQNIILPFLEKIDLLSYNDHSTPTHFMVGAIRNKFIAGIESKTPSPKSNEYALLLLPEGDHYDLILLYNVYQLKCRGIKTLYLGTNVPFKNLQELDKVKAPFVVVTYLPYKTKYDPKQLLDRYQSAFPQSSICITRPFMPDPEEVERSVGFHVHYSKLFESVESGIKEVFESRCALS